MAGTWVFNICSLQLFILLLLYDNHIFTNGTPIVHPFRVENIKSGHNQLRLLGYVNCTDPEEPPDFRCSRCNRGVIQPLANLQNNLLNVNLLTFTNNGPFDVYRLNTQLLTGFEFGVVFVPNTGHVLDYNVYRSYQMEIQCEGFSGNRSNIFVLEIDVLPNEPPRITNAPVDTITLDALVTPSGLIVYNTIATDPDADTLTYSMTVSPSTVDYFSINPQDGNISTVKHLLTATVNPVILTIHVTDGEVMADPPLTLTVNIVRMNFRPRIQNLPMNVTINENTPPGLVIAQLTLFDEYFIQSIDPAFTVDPPGEASKFEYRPNTREIRLVQPPNDGTTLDFESVNQLNLSFYQFDGYLSSVNEYIILNVADVNEPPVFTKTVHSCVLFESNQFGSSCPLGISITDPEGDFVRSPVLNPANNSHFFQLDNDNLRISNEYSVDNGARPTTAVLTIEVEDSKGATGSSLIQVTVLDQNTQTPTFGGSPTSAIITQGVQIPPLTLAQITATDADLTSPNNQVNMRLQFSNLGSHVIFSNDGRITYLNDFPSVQDCADCRMEIIAYDGGTPSRTATTTFFVGYRTTTTGVTTTTTSTTTTTTTTTPTTTMSTTTTSGDLLSTPGGAAIVGLLIALLVLLLLAVLGYFLYRYCTYGTCCGPAVAGAGGAGGAGGGGGVCGCCGPQQENPAKVRPEAPDAARGRTPPNRQPIRNDVYKSSGNYKDDFWNRNDGYMDFNRPASIKSVRIGGFTPPGGQRALPSTRPY